jgi:hypothetical protein
MTQAPVLAFSAAGVALLALGAGLWARFGDGVYFDWIASAVAGCLF